MPAGRDDKQSQQEADQNKSNQQWFAFGAFTILYFLG